MFCRQQTGHHTITLGSGIFVLCPEQIVISTISLWKHSKFVCLFRLPFFPARFSTKNNAESVGWLTRRTELAFRAIFVYLSFYHYRTIVRCDRIPQEIWYHKFVVSVCDLFKHLHEALTNGDWWLLRSKHRQELLDVQFTYLINTPESETTKKDEPEHK